MGGVETIGSIGREHAVTTGNPCLAALPQGPHRLDRGIADAEHRELRQVDLTESDVGPGVERAGLREAAGLAEKLLGAPGAAPGTVGDPFGHLEHRLARFEVSLGVAAVDVAQVEGDEPACRVEHIGRHRLDPLGHADGVGEHDG